MTRLFRFLRILVPALLLLVVGGCATVGEDFPAERVTQLEIGSTTQADVRRLFGPPWRTGIEDGYQTWTYGRYYYSAFGESTSKDLVVRFGPDNRVKSYSFNTTERSQ
ncbi:outer membrane protein assembly factor BamE [Marinobacteraceae bacterium S3BR75-40.1]